MAGGRGLRDGGGACGPGAESEGELLPFSRPPTFLPSSCPGRVGGAQRKDLGSVATEASWLPSRLDSSFSICEIGGWVGK